MAGQRIALPNYSMFVKTPIYEVDNDVVFGLQVPVVIPSQNDIIYAVPAQGASRLDLISTEFYGVPDLWWVIASVNNMADPLVSVPAGTNIRVPARERLASEGVLSI
jgi:hypothetical protein